MGLNAEGKMRNLSLAVVLLIGVLLAGKAAGQTVWKGPNTEGELRADAKEQGNPTGTRFALRCNPKAGLTAVLIMPDIAVADRVSDITLKTSHGSTAHLTVDQDSRLPGVIRLAGLDQVEADALDGGELMLRVSFKGRDQQIWRYDFRGIEADKTKVLKACPPF